VCSCVYGTGMSLRYVFWEIPDVPYATGRKNIRSSPEPVSDSLSLFSAATPVSVSTCSWRRNMENALKEPMMVVGSVLEDEGNQEEYSEWKLLLAVVTKSSVNSSYQNRDFRNKDGTPVIDPETYRKLQDEVTTISNLVMQKHVALYLILVFAISALSPDDGEASVQRVVGVHLVALILFHLVSHYVIFKQADGKLLAIVATYQAQFLERYGVAMGHCKGNKPIRWWSDDSGITLRRPQRRMTELSMSPVGMASDVLDGHFPPIYIQRDMPGHVYIDETRYDASMKVDAPLWTLLQSTHKELIQTPAFFQAVFFVLPLAVLAHGVVTIGWIVHRGPSSTNVSVFVGGLVLLIAFAMFMMFQEDKHNQRMYQEITQRVNTALLQKDETTGRGRRLVVMVEYHDENPKQSEKRRYQFVRQSAVEQDATTVETES